MTKFNKYIFIVNEYSKSGGKTSPLIKEKMESRSFPYEIHKTESAHHAISLANILGNKLTENHLLVVVGGDGTLNQVITGLKSSNLNVPISYLPTGSGNDFARSHKIPIKIEKALDNLLDSAKKTELDVLEIKQDNTTRYAINSTGAGLDGRVVQQIQKRRKKKKISSLTYLSSLVQAALKQKKFHLDLYLGDQKHSFDNVIIALCINNEFIAGGIHIFPDADAQDGKIDILVVEKMKFFELIRALFQLKTGARHLTHKRFHAFTSEHPILRVSPVQLGQQDGEPVKIYPSKYHVSVVKQTFYI